MGESLLPPIVIKFSSHAINFFELIGI